MTGIMIRRYIADALAAYRMRRLWGLYPRRLWVWLWLNAELDGTNLTERTVEP